jgi:hypothetical protein
MGLPRWLPRSVLLAFAILSIVSAALARPGQAPVPGPASKEIASSEEIQTRCGAVCHKLPPPDVLPRSAWRDELVRMMLITEGVPEPAGASSFIPLPPDWLRLLRYYEANAPERLADPEPWPRPADTPLAFTRRPLSTLVVTGAVAIANLCVADLDGDNALDIVASEMRSGPILAGFARNQHRFESIAQLNHPAHIEPIDLDRDGLLDLLVADLGSFQPADHDNGALYWLRRSRDGKYTPIVLAKGLARVADARAADFDGDGDLDIVLGIFGWRRTGNVTLLENRTKSWQKPVFVPRVLDDRTGAIHVPIVDLNKDGKPDIVILFAQQHESVVAFVNSGKRLEFTAQTLYAAPHPNWGSSGIDVVDLDKDGDLDVLMTHGDTFDDFVLKPYHGIQWLENTGTLPFTAHMLATLPGAQRAAAADMDGDGDLDVVASAMIAGGEIASTLASIVWLEQVAPRKFERRTIEMGTPYHATLDLADLDADGDQDIVIGWFSLGKPLGAAIDWWEALKK